MVERVADSVLEGDLEARAVRPLPYPLQRLAGFLGGSSVYLALIGLVMLVDLVWRGDPGVHGWALVGYLVGVVVVLTFSQVLCFLLAFCVGLAAFWLKRADLLLSVLLLAQHARRSALAAEPLEWRAAAGNGVQPFPVRDRHPGGGPGRLEPGRGVRRMAPGLAYIVGLSVLAGLLWRRALRSYHGAGG